MAEVGDLGRYQVLAASAPMLRAKRRVLRDMVDEPEARGSKDG